MEKVVLTFLAVAVMSAHSLSLTCTNETAMVIKECVFTSDLLAPSKLPGDMSAVNAYCSANATSTCLTPNQQVCSDNERQTKLINSLLTHERIQKGQMYLCENKTLIESNVNCLSNYSTVTTCLETAVGVLTDAGKTTDLKTGLDNMCTFFMSYAKCFDGQSKECQPVMDILKSAVNGLKYSYCDMDSTGKNTVVSAYTGAATFLISNIVSLLTLCIVAMFL